MNWMAWCFMAEKQVTEGHSLTRPGFSNYVGTAWATLALLRTMLSALPATLSALHDPQVPPTNNHAEQMLRPAVITRKVGGCSKTHWGALVHGVLASIITLSCKRQGKRFRDMARRLWQSSDPPAIPWKPCQRAEPEAPGLPRREGPRTCVIFRADTLPC